MGTVAMEAGVLVNIAVFTIVAVLHMALALPDLGGGGSGGESSTPGPQNVVIPVRYVSGPSGFPRFYVADFVFGMPQQHRTLSISGSIDLTWTFAADSESSDKSALVTPNAPNPPFQRRRSRTARKVTCSKGGCKPIIGIGPGVGFCATDGGCRYQYPQGLQSVVHGFTVRELVGLKSGFAFTYSRVGCTVSAEGPILDTYSDGVLSLTRSPNSFFRSMIGTLPFSRIMSICLNSSAGANSSGVIVFGAPREEVVNGPAVYTPIINDSTPGLASKFLIRLTGWSVGTVEQSGTFPLYIDPAIETSFLPQAAFGSLVSQINVATGMVNDPSFTAGISATCYVKQMQTCDASKFPDLTLKFGSVIHTVSGSDYTFTVPVPGGTSCAICLGIFGWPLDVSLAGANLIQKTWIIQDMETSSVGFLKQGFCY